MGVVTLEERVTSLERQMARLYDPEQGIYALVRGLETRITRWGLALVSSVAAAVAVELVTR